MKKQQKRKQTVYTRRDNKRKKRAVLKCLTYGSLFLLILLGLFLGIYTYLKDNSKQLNVDASQPEIDVQLLDVNDYSRPGIEIEEVNGVVIHYTANPGSTALDNRNYFNGLQNGQGTSVSSHFVVGLEGEIVQCIPTWEMAYASNSRNKDTVAIECCHPDETGEFTEETYTSLVQLTAYLCAKYELDEDDVIRHYDVTGKNCPKFFVENEDAWEEFKNHVADALAKGSGEENE